VRWIIALGIVSSIASAGCLSVGALEHHALNHERSSSVQAQLGDGETAAREAQLAASEHEASRLKAESRGRYWWREVLLR
jgi:hypothetical protein